MSERKILVIDDDPIILFMHESILGDIAPTAEIVCLENGKLAHDYIMGDGDSEFLLLLDINMPVLNGWGLLDLLTVSQTDSRVAVVIVTSSVNESDRIRANDYPIVRYVITKPLLEQDLRELTSDKRLGPFFYN